VTRRDDPLLVMPTWKIDVARRDAALLVMPTWKIDVARRVVALPVTPKWEIDVARRDPALLVTPKWKIDMARGAVALLFTSGYRHGKEGHSPPCHAETGCQWGWGLPGWSEIELIRKNTLSLERPRKYPKRCPNTT